jgi:hypothetical protein
LDPSGDITFDSLTISDLISDLEKLKERSFKNAIQIDKIINLAIDGEI